MTYIPKPNTGTLWPNNRKSAPNHPDMRGDIFFDEVFLQEMLSKAEGGLVKVSISCWDKNINGQNCFSMSASAPYVKQDSSYSSPQYSRPQPTRPQPTRQVVDDSDVPF